MNKYFCKLLGTDSTPKSFNNITENIVKTRREIEELREELRFVTNPILMNQIIYNLKSAETRYRYWYKLAREIELK